MYNFSREIIITAIISSLLFSVFMFIVYIKIKQEVQTIDIPEELEFTITKDSTTCDTLLAFKKNNTIHIRYK